MKCGQKDHPTANCSNSEKIITNNNFINRNHSSVTNNFTSLNTTDNNRKQ